MLDQSTHSYPDNSHHNSHRLRLWLAGVASVLLLIAATAVFVYRQPILDQIVVWNFKPSQQLEQAAERASINDTGKFYLYASRAEIVDRTAFNKGCASLQNEQTVVLGCYRLPEKQIFVYNIADKRLDGAIEVTAAHEMLHAAYDRLNESERAKLDEQLLELANTITDERLLDLIDHYKKTEPNAVVNELHSIFGTELASLPAELETYYGKYFVNRQTVVGLKNQYEKVFTDLRNRQNELVSELNAIAADVAARQAAYARDLADLNASISEFNTWNQSGQATVPEFNARRSQLQQRINQLQAESESINSAIDTYNSKKAELEALNLLVEGLNESINSKLSPAPSL